MTKIKIVHFAEIEFHHFNRIAESNGIQHCERNAFVVGLNNFGGKKRVFQIEFAFF